MIDPTHPLPIVRQCHLQRLTRSTASYQPMPVSETTLALIRRIDELHLQYSFAGARMLRDLLRYEGRAIGRRQVAALMRRMGIGPCIAKRRSAADSPTIGSSPICSETWRSRVRIRSGRRISPTFRCVVGSCISLPSWTGRVVGSWRSGCPTAYHGFLSGRSAGCHHPLWYAGDFQCRSRVPVHRPRVHGAPDPAW